MCHYNAEVYKMQIMCQRVKNISTSDKADEK